jgi:transposase
MGKEDLVSVQLTGAQVHDSRPAVEMLIPLEGQGIQRLVADKGYDDDKIREKVKDMQIKPDIPPRKNPLEHRFYDKTVYRWRWRIEALFGKFKENRRLALRVDKLDTSFLGFICLAFIKPLVC